MSPRPAGHVVALGLTLTTVASSVPDARAHFALRSPAAWLEQNNLGDPQKTGPCGDDGTGVPTGTVTTYAPGETITITLDETIFHPGHYRVALAVAGHGELPPPPPVTPGPTDCGSAPIMDPPVFPVLADGLLVHDAPFAGTQSMQVTLPSDVTCERCTLQVLEFMSSHGAPCFYYHCADIAIGAAPACTTDADCPDTDACTVDACGPEQTCLHAALGLDDVVPGFVGPLDAPACASESVPAAIGTSAQKAETLALRAATKPTKAARFLGRALKKLDKAAAKTTKAQERRMSPECGTALTTLIGQARSRVQCVADALDAAGE